MLSEVEAIMRKKQYHEVMVDHQMLSTLARWLRRSDDQTRRKTTTTVKHTHETAIRSSTHAPSMCGPRARGAARR